MRSATPSAPADPIDAVAVAIPVRDEAERVAACLGALATSALAQQAGTVPAAIVLLLNNCTDGTEAVVRGLAPGLPVPVHVCVAELPPPHAHAGAARALAMRRAACLAGPQGAVLTTDADSVVPRDWVARNLAALARGADAVAGQAVIDPDEARQIPQALHEADARECAYAALLDEIASLLDPDPADPWPRHSEESGASIAVRVAAWRRVGGMAPAALGEDRAFLDRLRRHDCAIRHDPAIRVRVSGRIDGRAAGGMADTMRRRMVAPDLFLDERLEHAAEAARRASLRRRARAAFAAGSFAPELARSLDLAPERLRALLDARCFGAAWEAMQAASPVLAARHPVPVADLARETRAAQAILRQLRAAEGGAALSPPAAAHPGDSAVAATA